MPVWSLMVGLNSSWWIRSCRASWCIRFFRCRFGTLRLGLVCFSRRFCVAGRFARWFRIRLGTFRLLPWIFVINLYARSFFDFRTGWLLCFRRILSKIENLGNNMYSFVKLYSIYIFRKYFFIKFNKFQPKLKFYSVNHKFTRNFNNFRVAWPSTLRLIIQVKLYIFFILRIYYLTIHLWNL